MGRINFNLASFSGCVVKRENFLVFETKQNYKILNLGKIEKLLMLQILVLTQILLQMRIKKQPMQIRYKFLRLQY